MSSVVVNLVSPAGLGRYARSLFHLNYRSINDNTDRQTDTALADCSHNIDMENCSKSNKCKFLMDSLFSEVFLIVS